MTTYFPTMIEWYLETIADFLWEDPVRYIFGGFVLLVVIRILKELMHSY